MTIERFSKQEFEHALPTNDDGEKLWEYVGFEKGEHVYKMQIKNGSVKRVAILIRSSVKADGYAAETGKDSIRLWLVNSKTNDSLGKKVDAYTTRTSGWQERMQEKLRTLYKRGLQMVNCPKCKTGVMLERNGKYGKFYGCSNFPSCRHTANSLDKIQTEPESKPEPKPANNLDLLAEELNETEFDFEPSKYQKDIFDFVENGEGNAVVEAVAGSGKTTTGIASLRFTPTDQDVAYLAFTKSNAKDLKKKAPRRAHVSTLHSLSFANIRRAFGNRVKVDGNKSYWIIKDELGENTPNKPAIIKLVSLLKATLLEPTDENLDYLATYYNINVNGDADQIYRDTKTVFKISVNQTWRIDFDDMIWLCATGKVNCKKFDFVFVDECQDLNKAQIKMLLNSIHENSRVIAIGDRKQSIYGFRGADTQAMENLIEALDAKLLPLSITYRCPKSHVELAQELVPQIEAPESAIEGNVEHIDGRQFLQKAQEGDMVLCRTNAPLIAPALELIRNGKKAVVLGREIGEGLVNLIEKIENRSSSNTISDLLGQLVEYMYSETTKLIKQDKEGKAQHLEDQIATIEALADGCKTITELKDRIDTIFSKDAQGVTFSSIHKAKGLESENVFILHPELMPHPMCLQSANPEMLQQERNIKYVALTRSKRNLYFVH